MLKTCHARSSTSVWIRFACTRRPLQMGVACGLYILLIALTHSVRAQKPQGKGKHGPAAADPKASVNAGHTLFQKNCSPCHGANGQGGEGPNLQKLKLTDAIIGTTIKKGVKGEMPAFGNKFKEADVRALTAFVHSIER